MTPMDLERTRATSGLGLAGGGQGFKDRLSLKSASVYVWGQSRAQSSSQSVFQKYSSCAGISLWSHPSSLGPYVQILYEVTFAF